MPDTFSKSGAFWLAVFFAAVLRTMAAPPPGETIGHRLLRVVFGWASGAFMAVYFTDIVVEWRSLDHETWEIPVAILLVFTGQAVIEFIASLNGEKIIELYKQFRGQK